MGSFIDNSLNYCISEFNKPHNKNRIKRDFVNPMLHYILSELKPYIFGLCLFLVTIILLMFFIVYLILVSN